MTPDSQTPAPSTPAAPYSPPSLTPLGTVDALTAGPNEGAIDQIFGGSGGFQERDATS